VYDKLSSEEVERLADSMKSNGMSSYGGSALEASMGRASHDFFQRCREAGRFAVRRENGKVVLSLCEDEAA